MSLLAPLYALGLLAIAAPIVFHLIRRSPRGEVPFSSLMFLAPSPPRLARRSRLDHIALLLLRAAALALLAFGFARPFLRESAGLDLADAGRSRVVVLLDASASMRRGDLWPRARAAAERAVADCGPGDQLAVLAFDAATRPLLGFEESATLDPARRRAVASSRLRQLGPTWGPTDLGHALIDAVASIESVADRSEAAGRMPRRIVLIGDLQQGSRLDALGAFEWPSDVTLDLRPVADDRSNAGLHALDDPEEAEGAAPIRRVRVTNDPNSRRESFTLAWFDEKGNQAGPTIPVYVPPGEGRVVRVPDPPGPAHTLRLTGDAHAFDNTLYFAGGKKEDVTVLYVGPDRPDDPSGLLYYLRRVFPDTPRRSVRVVAASPSEAIAFEPGRPVPLVVISAETTPENARRLRDLARGGATVLDVLTAPGPAGTLAALADAAPRPIEEAKAGPDVMLGEVAFDHPMFAPFAVAQFNDFTKIHFWKYRKVAPDDLGGGARVLARFENGDAAIVEQAVGKGSLVVLASGWHPADSQLARSSKFVPMMAALLEGRGPRALDASRYRVGDRVPIPAGSGPTVRKPNGATVPAPADGATFAGTDQPGIYRAGARSFAVNLDPAESRTAPLHAETLEQLGCRLADPARESVGRERLRQMHNEELEGRQKLWRWLILASAGILIVETWLAGRLERPRAEATSP